MPPLCLSYVRRLGVGISEWALWLPVGRKGAQDLDRPWPHLANYASEGRTEL